MSVFFGILTAVALILLAVLLLLTLVFFSRIRIFLVYREKLEVLLKIWFVKINITKLASRSKKEKKPKKVHFTGELFGEFPEKPEKKAKNEKKKETRKAEHSGTPKPAGKKSVSEIIEMIKDIFSDISAPLAKCMDVKIHRLFITAASPEAADTAVMFGHMNTAVGSLILACKKFRSLDIDESSTGVYSDFNSEKPRLDTEIELVFRVRHISVTGIKALMSYLKHK